MNSFDRLALLYNRIGLNTEIGTINRAELMAYCAGIDFVKDALEVAIDTDFVSKAIEFNGENFHSFVDDECESWYQRNNYVLIYHPNIENISKIAAEWFSPFYKIIFYGEGLPWSEYTETWLAHDRRHLAWSMIDTMEENDG